MNLPAEDVLHHASPAVSATYDSADFLLTGFLVVTGCVAAAMAAVLSCQLPRAHTLSWTTIIFLALQYLTLTTIGGGVGISIPWLFLRAKSPFLPTFLAANSAVAWVFFPAITLLYRRQSLWIFPVLTLSTIVLALSLRRTFPASAENSEDPPTRCITDLPNLYGLPITPFRPLRSFVIAICAQAALFLAIAGRLLLASILLSASLFLLVWRWSASDSSATRMFSGRRQFIQLCAFAIILTVLALVPWIGGNPQSGLGGSELSHRPPVPHPPTAADRPNSDYIGVILWPPPVKKQILPPIPHASSFAIGRTSKPIVILFDGQYWYFKAPSKRPGSRAHIAHGRPTDVNVRSSDFAPLLMEAHQNLGSSIDLSCCSEIDVAITNGDTRPGKIALGILLTDSNSLGKSSLSSKSLDLGERTITSSEAQQIPLNRPPVIEILHFPISPSATMRQFNEITIVFMPAKERARAGAKVSIQSFALVPK